MVFFDSFQSHEKENRLKFVNDFCQFVSPMFYPTLTNISSPDYLKIYQKLKPKSTRASTHRLMIHQKSSHFKGKLTKRTTMKKRSPRSKSPVFMGFRAISCHYLLSKSSFIRLWGFPPTQEIEESEARKEPDNSWIAGLSLVFLGSVLGGHKIPSSLSDT